MKILLVFLLGISACTFKQEKKQDFNNDLIDVVVKHSDNKVTQIFIPHASDTSYSDADLRNRKVILAEILKSKGFKVETSEFQLNNGCGQMLIKLDKQNCHCTVYAVYEGTKQASQYWIRENISCK